MSGPTPPQPRGRHASPDFSGGLPSSAWRASPPPLAGGPTSPGSHRVGTPDDGRSTGPLLARGLGTPGLTARQAGSGGPEDSAHPSAPLPDLPPRPSGAWSRLQRRTDDADDDETVARPLGAVPAPPREPRGDDAHALDPHDWDDEQDSTGGLEVLGAAASHESRRSRRRRRNDGHDDGSGPPPGGGGPSSGGPRRGRRSLAAVLSLVVLAGLVVGIVVGGKALIGLVNPPSQDFAGQGSGDVEVRIAVGDTLSDIARSLVDAGVIASVGPFVQAAESEPAATGIQPGVYAMRSQMSGQAALDLLLDPATRLFSRVTIPEGFTVEQVLQRLSEATQRPIEELRAAAADPAALGLPAYAGGQLEGFLFPATYDFTPDDAPVDMLRAMVAEFTETATSLQLEQRAAATGRTAYDVVTVASMIQSETRLDEERADVAQVIYNRLERGIALGIDATLAYGLAKNGNELTVSDLETDGPYNTRTRPGLPPTPISSPGRASLEAALAPTDGDLLYYVLESEDGRHFFTADYAEFMAARQRCAAAGLGCGG